MSGFYNVENLGEFIVNDPLLNIQENLRELNLETLYNGGIFDLESTKEIIVYNAAYRSNAVFVAMSGSNTGTIAQLTDGFEALTSSTTTNITSLSAVSTLNGLRDVYINLYLNNLIFGINSGYLIGKINNIFATSYIISGIRQTLYATTPISPLLFTLLGLINDIFDAVEKRDFVTANAARATFIAYQTTNIPNILGQLSTAYATIAGVGFSSAAYAYFGDLFTAFNATPPENPPGDTQAIANLAKQTV
jgi:hypothetical protein